MSHDAEFGLILPFDTDDAEFIRGWEAAELWADLTTMPSGVTAYERTIHTANLEMALRMAERTNWSLRPESATTDEGESLDDWTVIVMARIYPQPEPEEQ